PRRDGGTALVAGGRDLARRACGVGGDDRLDAEVADRLAALTDGMNVAFHGLDVGERSALYPQELVAHRHEVLAHDVQAGMRHQVMDVGDAAGDRVLDRDHAEFGFARCYRCETVFERRAGHCLSVRIGLADGEVRVRTRLALKHDSTGHGRCATPSSNPSVGPFLITAVAASYSRFKSQNHTEIINLLVSGGR